MSEHYYTKNPQSKLVTQRIKWHLRGTFFEFETGSGTFSKSRIDAGSALLIEEVSFQPGDTILDLGCGYGPVGIAVKKTCPQCTVVMTDVNKRATGFAKKNAKLNDVVVDVRSGDGYESVKGEQFNAILLNPPQTAGKQLCNQMIEQAKAFLVDGGLFWLVARHNKGGSSFEEKMEEVFGNVETIAKQSGFRVYRSKKTV